MISLICKTAPCEPEDSQLTMDENDLKEAVELAEKQGVPVDNLKNDDQLDNLEGYNPFEGDCTVTNELLNGLQISLVLYITLKRKSFLLFDMYLFPDIQI